jgi:hypothetical protein
LSKTLWSWSFQSTSQSPTTTWSHWRNMMQSWYAYSIAALESWQPWCTISQVERRFQSVRGLYFYVQLF